MSPWKTLSHTRHMIGQIYLYTRPFKIYLYTRPFTYIQDHLKFTYIQDHLKFTYIQDHFCLTNQNPAHLHKKPGWGGGGFSQSKSSSLAYTRPFQIYLYTRPFLHTIMSLFSIFFFLSHLHKKPGWGGWFWKLKTRVGGGGFGKPKTRVGGGWFWKLKTRVGRVVLET